MQDKETTLISLREHFEEILSTVLSPSEGVKALHEVEKDIFIRLLALGRELLVLYINLKLKGLAEKKVDLSLINKGNRKRVYKTIFGELSFSRTKYYDFDLKKTTYLLDNALGLSKCKYSYLLQDFMAYSATEKAFSESVELLNKIFGLKLYGTQSERLSSEMSLYIDEYYTKKEVIADTDIDYFALGFDGKGVPIRAGSLGRLAQSNGVRLGKGEKRDVKRESTVSVGYSLIARPRSSAEVISSLFKEEITSLKEPLESSKKAKNKHIRAFMGAKSQAIDYGFKNILERMADNPKPIVVLIDGARSLEKAVDKSIESQDISHLVAAKVLDFIHVTEYVWKVANAHFGEKNGLRLAWVKQQCQLILESKTEQVIGTLEALLIENKDILSTKKAIQRSLTYFKNHLHMMDYGSYLEKGYPISTGAIESACGHFVQSRMERNGMHWTEQGAQNMLNLRAANKNQDWEGFMDFYIQKEQQNQEYRLVA